MMEAGGEHVQTVTDSPRAEYAHSSDRDRQVPAIPAIGKHAILGDPDHPVYDFPCLSTTAAQTTTTTKRRLSTGYTMTRTRPHSLPPANSKPHFPYNRHARSRSTGALPSAPTTSPKKPSRIKRRPRTKDDLDLIQLTDQMESYFALYKRDPREIFDVVDTLLHEEHKGQYLPSQQDVLVKPKHRDSRHGQIRTLAFKSVRGEHRIPLLLDTDCVRVDKENAKLRHLYNQGIFNEDNDTDDSGRDKGVEKNFKVLQAELDKRKGSRKTTVRQYGLNKRSQVATVTPASVYDASESAGDLSCISRREEVKPKPGIHKVYELKKKVEINRTANESYLPITTGLKKLKGQEPGQTFTSSRPHLAEKLSKEPGAPKINPLNSNQEPASPNYPGSPPLQIQERKDSNSMEEESPTKLNQPKEDKMPHSSPNSMEEERAVSP